jgi:hypothetical protein
MLWTVSEHFGPLCLMAAIIFGSQAFTRRIQHERLRAEAGRLRGALTVSLRSLRTLHKANLRVLAGGRPPLISGRQQMNLLRPQLGRLISLDQPEIEAVIAATIAVEAVETAMAIAGKTVGGVAFTVPDGEAKGMLESALLQACSMLETAEVLMTPNRVQGMEESSEVLTSPDSNALEICGQAGRRDFIESVRSELRR